MKNIIVALKALLFFTVLTGIVYPLIITCLSQVLFPMNANGNLIIINNKIIGSKLIGQQFDSVVYFSSRPSAINYNPLPSGGSNYSITSAKLKDIVNSRRREFIKVNNLDSLTIVPSEMIFASASGLDPHISPEAALLQVERVAIARKFTAGQKERLIQLIKEQSETPYLLYHGRSRVNVLLLNLEIDKIK